MSEAAATGASSGAAMTRVLTDERLARRAVKGDERAFATIFDRYHQRLYRYCLAIVGNSEDAQDALQNTMVKVLRALPGEERRIELKPWLYRIAHNESIELLRRRRDTRELDAELAAPGAGLAAEAGSRERLRRLLSDLDQLPERQRGVLVMRELAGLGFAEIGAALQTSSGAARQALYEARLSLRQMEEGRDMSCAEVMRALSDGDGRVGRRRDLRAHLRSCSSCRRFGEEIGSRQRDLAALSPLPAVAAAGLLQSLLGGGLGGGGGGLAAAVGGGAAKSAGASLALKGAATVAVVAAIGAGAADRGGLIDAGLPGGGGSPATEVDQAAGAGAAEPAGARLPGADAPPGDAGFGGRKGGGGLGGAAVAKPAATAGRPPTTTAAAAAPIPAPTSRSAAAAHPHGRGKEKQLPAAAAAGQRNAATHRGADRGSGGAGAHPAASSHPAKPPHPPHPSTPASEKPPAPDPSSAPARAPEPRPPGNAATQAAGAEARVETEVGKKP